MNWSLRDAIFTGRSFRNYDTLLVWEWKIYYRKEEGEGRAGDAGFPASSRTWGCVKVSWSVL